MTVDDAAGAGATPRTCPQCGESLAPKAAFCRACGTKYEPPAAPTCGSCGAALTANSAFCRACGAPASADAAPTQKLDPVPPKPPPPTPPPTPPRVAPPPTPPPPPAGGSRNWIPVVIGVLVLLVGAGVAVAIVAGKNSGGSQTTTVEQVAVPGAEGGFEEEPGVAEEPGVEGAEAEEEPVQAEGESTSSGFPNVARSQMNEEISSLLQSYHEDLVEEDFQGAWALLSSRKRHQYLREYGYRKWTVDQATLTPYLRPYGLEADVVSLEGEGVARVDVTGMGWSKPGAPCSEWSGLTWVKYEGGQWTYDPGYSTTASRRATWRPRSARLLGGDCAE